MAVVDEKKKAKSRLFDLRTQAVGIVGRAANQRTWLVRKDEAGVPEEKLIPEVKADLPVTDPAALPATSAATDPGAAAPLAMPSATKTALSTLLATMLDSMSSIASAVESSTVDEAAGMPADLIMQLDVLGDGLDEGIEAMVPSEEVTDAAPEFLPGEDAATQKAAKPTPPVSRARRLMAQKRLKAMGEHHKAINEGHSMIGKGMTGLAKMMSELSGKPATKADPGKEAPVVDEKTEKSFVAPHVDIAALFSSLKVDMLEEMKKAIAPVLARATAAGLRASVPLPRSIPVEGGPPPAPEKSGDFKAMLKDAQKKKT